MTNIANRSNRYFQGVRREVPVCRTFQSYLEYQHDTKTFLQKRPQANAHIDFLGREYDPKTNITIKELAVEVRTINMTQEQIYDTYDGNIQFPLSKLNECMKFWRMGKAVYIVYELSDMVGVLEWNYYVTHNFEVSLDGKYLLLPLRNFIKIGQ